MDARRIGLLAGPVGLALTQILAPPQGMDPLAWSVAGLTLWMAIWWMTEALPLAITALLPFLVLPLSGVASAGQTASTYYSPIVFLILGGAFIALAIERTGLHRRFSLFILKAIGQRGGHARLLLAFMISAALLSMLISNTSAALIMMPMAMAVLAAGGSSADLGGVTSEGARPREGLYGALPIGIAFAASIGGLGTIIGSPTNAIAAGLLADLIGLRISFVEWSLYGLPLVAIGIALAAFILARVHRIEQSTFDLALARAAMGHAHRWSLPERRLVPFIALAFLLWMSRSLVEPWLPPGSWSDGSIAIAVGVMLFLVPDGTGRPMLRWSEANRAPWDVILMIGGGLALASAIDSSGLARWLSESLLFLRAVPLPIVAMAAVALVIVVTEFASNVATASGIIPVIAALVVVLGADPMLLAMPAALAASWGFMLPAGTGPNAIAWSTGHVRIGNMVRAGLMLDLAGVVLIPAGVWTIAFLLH